MIRLVDNKKKKMEEAFSKVPPVELFTLIAIVLRVSTSRQRVPYPQSFHYSHPAMLVFVFSAFSFQKQIASVAPVCSELVYSR